jgi:hypothetical protein
MANREEIKREYGAMKDRILNEVFELAASAQHHQGQMSPELEQRLGPNEANRLRAAEAEMWAEAERERLKTRHEELDIEMRAAIQVLMDEIEEKLRPKDVSFEDLSAASSASPESLRTTMDLALAGGHEDAALLAFQVARERDLEEVISHAITVNERWAELYSDLTENENDVGLELDAGDKFETLAPKAPSRFDILAAPKADIDVYGAMR